MGAACGTPVAPTGTDPAAAPSATAGASAADIASASAGMPTALPVSSSSPSIAAAPTPSAPTASSVAIDPGLLAVLPATVEGLPIAPVDQPTGANDPAMADTVERLAQAIAIDPASGDFAYSSVIALRPGVFSTQFFDAWRASFDEGACSQSGGVGEHTRMTIAGRTVYVGTCQGGVTTYHVRLAAGDRIVSISAFGEHRLGERILADLRP